MNGGIRLSLKLVHPFDRHIHSLYVGSHWHATHNIIRLHCVQNPVGNLLVLRYYSQAAHPNVNDTC